VPHLEPTGDEVFGVAREAAQAFEPAE
jgi:hypothetical protein